MARVTEADVLEVYTTDVDLEPYINMAHIVTNRLAACNDDDTLFEIERLLSAHFASTANPSGRGGGITSDSFGDASRSYGVTFGQSFAASTYGQSAMLLDNCGLLADMGKRKARFSVL